MIFTRLQACIHACIIEVAAIIMVRASEYLPVTVGTGVGFIIGAVGIAVGTGVGIVVDAGDAPGYTATVPLHLPVLKQPSRSLYVVQSADPPGAVNVI